MTQNDSPASARSIDRRDFLRASALVASSFALPGITQAQAADADEIRAVMHSGIRVLDPVITTAHITRNHGYMIYDTFIAMDANAKPQPQMASWTISDDKLTYTFTLRDGLKWHDGKPVTAKDCVASLKRWASRDGGGQILMKYVKSLEASDDKTVTLTLSQPFTYVLELLGKPSGIPTFMMPERVAKAPGTESLTDHTGSGPFRFVEKEYQPGVQAVYEKFEDYVPRSEPPSWTAGGKVVKVKRVKWINMPDAQTSINAISSGEIDFIEAAPVDLLPILKANPDLTVDVLNALGNQTMCRMNWLYPPFNDVKIRRAVVAAFGDKPFLDALIGNPDYQKVCPSMYGCGTSLSTDAGSKLLMAGPAPDTAKQMLKDAGYDGTPVVLMQPTDVGEVSSQPVVAAQLLRQAGFKVDLQPMDWQTLVTRRASQAKPSEGGWNMFFTNWVVPEIWNPLVNPMLNGGGKKSAWFGWPDDPKLDEMREKFAMAKSEDERKEVAANIQEHAYDVVNYVPLGSFLTPSAWRKNLSGIVAMPVPVFWNVAKKA